MVTHVLETGEHRIEIVVGRRGRTRLVDEHREGTDGRRGEDAVQRQLDVERGTDLGDDLRCEERVAAEREEVVVDTDPRLPQHLGPDRGDPFLGLGPGLDDHTRLVRLHLVERRQRLAIELSIRGQRQRRQRDVRGRDHVVGQPPGETGAQLCAHRCGTYDVRDQPSIVGTVALQHDCCLRHARLLPQYLLDLGELDAKTAELDLRVETAQERDGPVGKEAGEIARAVDARPGRIRERVRHEPFGGLFRLPPVTARQTGPGDAQLTGCADRQRLQVLIEHVDLGVRDRAPDRHHW